jgi:hypothetical protein
MCRHEQDPINETEDEARNVPILAINRAGVELSQVCSRRNWSRSTPATLRHATPIAPDLSEGGGKAL